MSKATEHLYTILREVLNYTAVGVHKNEDDTIELFFDGCCECTIRIEKYEDLRESY